MRQLQVNGGGLHVVEGGAADGPALVFVNALGTDLRVWDQVVARLPPEFRLIRYDKRGHGLSSLTPSCTTIAAHAADLAGLLDALAVRRALVVGLSIGGPIAQTLAVARPDLAARLVLLASAHRIGSAESWGARIKAVQEGGMEAIADSLMERWFSRHVQRERADMVAAWRSLVARTPAEGYVAACTALRDADLADLAVHTPMPVHFAVGSRDLATPPEQVQAAAALIPHAGFEVIEGAGHLLPVEQPERVVAILLDQLAKARRSDPAAVGEAGADALDEGTLERLGEAVRRRVLGDTHVDRAAAQSSTFDAPFQQLITRAAWGTVWSRPDLTPRERSIVTLALLAALGHHDEFALHVRASRNTGATQADLREALLHVAIYAGVPAANSAFRLARKIHADLAGAGPDETQKETP